MTAVRRRIIRNQPVVLENQRRNDLSLLRTESRLGRERTSCHRWLSKLRRALRAVDKSLDQIARLEKKLSVLRQA